MSKKLSTKQRTEMINRWQSGESEQAKIKSEGYYVMTNKNGVLNVRKNRPTKDTPKDIPTEPEKRPKTDRPKPNVL